MVKVLFKMMKSALKMTTFNANVQEAFADQWSPLDNLQVPFQSTFLSNLPFHATFLNNLPFYATFLRHLPFHATFSVICLFIYICHVSRAFALLYKLQVPSYCEFRLKWPLFQSKTVLKTRPFQSKFAVKPLLSVIILRFWAHFLGSLFGDGLPMSRTPGSLTGASFYRVSIEFLLTLS